MFFKKIIKSFAYKYYSKKFKRTVSSLGKGIAGPSARVILQDGSDHNDIIIGNNYRIFGLLHSQSNGKIIIGDWVTIGRNVQIRSCKEIKIGSNTVIAANVIIQDNNTHPISPKFREIWSQMPDSSDMHYWKWSFVSPVYIGNNVWIGENSRICKGVTIGNNSVIGAGSIVTKDIPDNSVAVGNPARIVKSNIDQLPFPPLYSGVNLDNS